MPSYHRLIDLFWNCLCHTNPRRWYYRKHLCSADTYAPNSHFQAYTPQNRHDACVWWVSSAQLWFSQLDFQNQLMQRHHGHLAMWYRVKFVVCIGFTFAGDHKPCSSVLIRRKTIGFSVRGCTHTNTHTHTHTFAHTQTYTNTQPLDCVYTSILASIHSSV